MHDKAWNRRPDAARPRKAVQPNAANPVQDRRII